jgi:hypothetical protein
MPRRKLLGLSVKEIETSIKESRKTKTKEVELQRRDYDILRFLLEQKFASLEAIYFRFFDKRKSSSEPLPKNLWTTRQRLSKLRSLALIKTEKVLSSSKAHFLITPMGYGFLKHEVKDTIIIKPTKQIDFSLYEHDVRITLIRAFLEARGKSKRWYSEKYLKASAIFIGNIRYKFSKDIRPDAVFTNSKNERVGFELEMSRKGPRRLLEKIRLYDNLLDENSRRGFGEEPFKILEKVWFVVTKKPVFRALTRAIESSRFRLCYRIDFYDQVIPGGQK